MTECWQSDDQDILLWAVPNGYFVLAVSRAEGDIIIGGKAVDGHVWGGGLPLCTGIAGNPVDLDLSISALPSRLSVLGLMSNLPALLHAIFSARNPLLTISLMNFVYFSNSLSLFGVLRSLSGTLMSTLRKLHDCTHTKRFNRLLKSFELHQHVADPTHNQGEIFLMFLILETICIALICLCMRRLSRNIL